MTMTVECQGGRKKWYNERPTRERRLEEVR